MEGPHPFSLIYVPSSAYRQDQPILDPKATMCFFDNFSFPGTRSSVGRGSREHTQYMFKMKFMENMVLGQVGWMRVRHFIERTMGYGINSRGCQIW